MADPPIVLPPGIEPPWKPREPGPIYPPLWPTQPTAPAPTTPSTPQTPPDAPGTTKPPTGPQLGPSGKVGAPGPLGPLGEPLARGGKAVTKFTVQKFAPGHEVRVWRGRDGAEYTGITKDVLSISTDSVIDTTGFEFTITLIPIRYLVGTDDAKHYASWAEILRPMDYIEISLSEEVGRYKETPTAIHKAIVANERGWPRVILRGFITSIKMVDTVEPRTGQPQRRVVVSGMNLGKLWQNYKMFTIIEKNEAFGRSVYAKYQALFPAKSTPSEFLSVVFNLIFKPQRVDLEKIFPQIARHEVRCTVPGGTKYAILQSENTLTNFQGSLDNLLRKFSVTPYMEFYTHDEPYPSVTGGHSVTTWRWSPYTNRANQFPLPEHVKDGKPNVWTLHAYELTQFEVGTSDIDVYTYYWAGPGQGYGPAGDNSTFKFSSPGYLDRQAMGIYGYRPLEPAFPLYGALRGTTPPATQTGSTNTSFNATDPIGLAPQIEELTNWLAATNENNANTWEGQLECNGRPDIICGDYLDIPEAGLRFYIQGVHHNYTFPDRFVTRIDITRGIPIDGDMRYKLPPGYEFDPNKPDPLFPDIPASNQPKPETPISNEQPR